MLGLFELYCTLGLENGHGTCHGEQQIYDGKVRYPMCSLKIGQNTINHGNQARVFAVHPTFGAFNHVLQSTVCF